MTQHIRGSTVQNQNNNNFRTARQAQTRVRLRVEVGFRNAIIVQEIGHRDALQGVLV